MSGFVVKYKVDGFKRERTTKPYPDKDTAISHADDIRGYVGVQYVIVVPAKKRSKNGLRPR